MAQFAHRMAGGHSPEEGRAVIRHYRRALSNAAECMSCLSFGTALRTLHAMIDGADRPSNFRTLPVACRAPRPGSPVYMVGIPWRKVPQAIDDIESSLLYTTKIDPFSRTTLVHFEMLYIHPFGDGNGRLARAVLTTMLTHAVGVPLTLDFTRPMRSVFGPYNKLLRSRRDGDTYRRWVDLFSGFLAAETNLVERVAHALSDLGPAEVLTLRRIVHNAQKSVEEGGPADIILRNGLAANKGLIRSILTAILS